MKEIFTVNRLLTNHLKIQISLRLLLSPTFRLGQVIIKHQTNNLYLVEKRINYLFHDLKSSEDLSKLEGLLLKKIGDCRTLSLRLLQAPFSQFNFGFDMKDLIELFSKFGRV